MTGSSLGSSAFESLPIAAGVHDRETLLACNALMRSFLRAEKPEDLVGKPISSIVHPDGHEAGRLRRELLIEHRHRFHSTPVKLRAVDGEPRVAIGSGMLFTVGDEPMVLVYECPGSPCVGIAAGVSVPPPAFDPGTPVAAAAIATMPVPVVVARESTIIFANPAAAALLDARSAEDLKGRSVFEFAHEDQLATTTEQVSMVLQHDTQISGPVKWKTLSGTTRHGMGTTKCVHHEGERLVLLVGTEVHGSV